MIIIILFWLVTFAAALDGWTALNIGMFIATSILTFVVGYGAIYQKRKFKHDTILLEMAGVWSIFGFLLLMMIKFGTLIGRHYPYV